MKVTLGIDRSKCIKCGRCVKVCPAKIFVQPGPDSEVKTVNIESCIVCGHCVAVCPTDAVIHGNFPAEKVHKIDRAGLPAGNQVMELIKSRRSNRGFSEDPVPREKLDLILEAAHRAPTASNLQQVGFTVITDQAKIKAVADFTVDVFDSMARKGENKLLSPILKAVAPDMHARLPGIRRMINEYRKGTDLIMRNATTLILIHAPVQNRFGCQDVNLAYQNGSLMAESIGVSQFYTGFVCAAIKQDKGKKMKEMFGIEGMVHAGMGLGMPQFRYPKYIDKKDMEVDWFE